MGQPIPPDWHWQTTAPKSIIHTYIIHHFRVRFRTLFFSPFFCPLLSFQFCWNASSVRIGFFGALHKTKLLYFVHLDGGWWFIISIQLAGNGYIYFFLLLLLSVYYLSLFFHYRVASDLFSLWMCRIVVTPMSESKDARRFFHRFSFWYIYIWILKFACNFPFWRKIYFRTNGATKKDWVWWVQKK